MNVNVGERIWKYEVVEIVKNANPIWGDLYILKSDTETLKLYTLELLNNIELWGRRGLL